MSIGANVVVLGFEIVIGIEVHVVRAATRVHHGRQIKSTEANLARTATPVAAINKVGRRGMDVTRRAGSEALLSYKVDEGTGVGSATLW